MREWLSTLPLGVIGGLRIGLIILIAAISALCVRLASKSIQRQSERALGPGDRFARAKTVIQAVENITNVLISAIAILMILTELGINIAPILASAGLAGLALSLGLQSFIRDYFGGMLILTDNLFRVGDIIQVGDNRGKVERMTLRVTYLRNQDGELVILPNGDIRTFRNLTTDWSMAVVTLNVPRDSDMEVIMRALNNASLEIRQDESVKSFLLEDPEAQGWIDLTDSAIQMRFTVKTVPGKQWEVAQAMRRYALEAMRKVNIPAESREGA
jgi:moderate conductance mechanosensitive channel